MLDVGDPVGAGEEENCAEDEGEEGDHGNFRGRRARSVHDGILQDGGRTLFDSNLRLKTYVVDQSLT